MNRAHLVALFFLAGGLTVSFRPATAQATDHRIGSSVCVTNPVPTIIGTGAPRPGQTIRFDLYSERDRYGRYQAATSLGIGPIRIGKQQIQLALDPLFLLSISGLAPNIFEKYAGFLDGNGRRRIHLHIPGNPRLIGVRLHTAFITMSSGLQPDVRTISSPYILMITR